MSLSRTIGLASSTSGSRSSSAERRLTNVVFALRITLGSRPADSPSASPLEVSALVVVARSRVRSASTPSRAETSVTRRAVSTMKRSKSGVLRLSSANSRADEDSAGLR